MRSTYKPIGGVESVALYPADAVVAALFSSEGCEVEFSADPIEVVLMEDASTYEEKAQLEHSVATVTHQLSLVAEKNDAERWLTGNFFEQAALDGLIAVVTLCDGRHLLVGYSAKFENEQPLHLTAITSSSGTTPHDTPTITLQLVSHDTDFSSQIL